MDVGALTTLEPFACTIRKRRRLMNLDKLAPYVITARNDRQYRGNSRRFESNYRQKQAQLSERKKRWHTDRLLGTRRLRLKEGAPLIFPRSKNWGARERAVANERSFLGNGRETTERRSFLGSRFSVCKKRQTLLGNGLVNTFPRQQIRIQQPLLFTGFNIVVIAEKLKGSQLGQISSVREDVKKRRLE
jgi:hypothetical protein